MRLTQLPAAQFAPRCHQPPELLDPGCELGIREIQRLNLRTCQPYPNGELFLESSTSLEFLRFLELISIPGKMVSK